MDIHPISLSVKENGDWFRKFQDCKVIDLCEEKKFV